MEIIEGLMKLDYFFGHKYKPRKIWWDFTWRKSEQAAIMRRLASMRKTSLRNLLRLA